MNRKEEIYAILGLFLGVLGCIAAWLAVPQIQPFFASPTQIAVAHNPINISSPKPTPDCSVTTELGPWPTTRDVLIDATDGWVQADFWSPTQQFKDGYNEVSVIFEPGLKFTVSGVAGTAWKYDKNMWTAEGVQNCTTKHIDDTYKYLKNRYAQISVEELCNKTQCH